MNALYTAEAISTGQGRERRASTSDGTFNVTMAPLRELGGLIGGTHPKRLFAAGSKTRFSPALNVVARDKKNHIENSTVGSRMQIGHNHVRGNALTVDPEVTSPDLPQQQARELADGAHLMCLYSCTTRVSIDVTLQVSND